MKNIVLFVATLLVGSMASATVEVCVVGAGISENKDTGEYAYETGIGPDGAKDSPVTALNEQAAAALSFAAKNMPTNIQYCMRGTQQGDHFMVYTVNAKKLMPGKE